MKTREAAPRIFSQFAFRSRFVRVSSCEFFDFRPGNSSVVPRALFINNNVAVERRAPDEVKNRAIIGDERVR